MSDRRERLHRVGLPGLLAAGLVAAAFLTPPLPAQEPAPVTEPAAPAPAAEPAPPEAPAAPAEAEPALEQPVEPEPAPRPERRRRSRRTDAQVVVGSSLTIDADEVTDDVVVVGGNLTIEGEVLGDAAVIGGWIRIDGKVTGDVAAIGGNLELGPAAEVYGDVMSFGGQVVRDDGAVIRGELVEVTSPGLHLNLWPHLLSWRSFTGDHWIGYSPFGWIASQAWRVFGLVLLFLFSCLALLLGRTPIERIGRRAAAEPWKSGLVGLTAQILFIPLLLMVIIILCVSIIGIPFLLLLPFALVALGLVLFFGYVGVALKLGELLQRRFGWSIESPYLVLLVGLGGLHLWALIGNMLDFNGPPLRLLAGLFMLFGFFACYVAFTLACGGALLTRFATADGWGGPAGTLPQPAPPPSGGELLPPAAEPLGEEPWEPEIEPGEGDRR